MPGLVTLDDSSARLLRREIADLQRHTRQLERTLAHLIARNRRLDSVPTRRKIRFRNDNSGTAPRYGVLRITGAQNKSFLKIDQPDSTYRWLYLVNGPNDVPTGKYGFGTFLTAEHFRFRDNYVLYDTGNTPAYGEEWGPKPSSWLLWKQRPGFFILGDNDTSESGKERTLAIQRPPAEVRVKNDSGGDVAAGDTGTAYSLFGGSSGTTDLGYDVTAANDMSISFKSNKYGSVGMLAGRLQVITWQT